MKRDEGRPAPLPYRPSLTRRARGWLRLLLLRLLASLYRPQPQPLVAGPQQAPSLLLIRPDHLGDLLFTTPALRALRQALPEARITLMTGPWARPVVERNPNINELITCEFPGFTRRNRPSFSQPYVYLWSEAQRLVGRRFDVALILRFDHWWGALLAYLAGIPQRIGYGVAEVSPFLTQALPYREGVHQVLQNMALIEAVRSIYEEPMLAEQQPPGEFTPSALPLEFPLMEDEEEWAERFLAQRGVEGGQPVITIHPGAGAPVKLWPAPAWGEVANALLRRYRAAVLLTGSASEADLCREVAASIMQQPLLAAGLTSLGQLGALYRRSALVLGPDCGPLHLAVATGTPTVHLYGPVGHQPFGPWGEPARHRILLSDLPCIPCNHLDYGPQELPGHPCVRLIRPAQVIAAAEEILG
jgi:lipopolysaccharide heptosyltransferase II